MTQALIPNHGHDTGLALRGNAACVMAVVFFAAGFPAAEVLLQSWGPLSLITARCLLACALLVPVWIMMDGWRSVAEAPWLRGLTIGALGFGIGTILLLAVQDWTDPVTAALVAATMPVSAVALEVLLDGRRLTRNFLAGLVLVLLGGLLATGADLSEGQYGAGVLFGVLASLLFAWGSRQTVKGLPGMSTIGQITITLFGAMMFCLAAYDVFMIFGLPGTHVAPLDFTGWSMLLVYAWGAMAISQVFWIFGVARIGIGIASFHLNAAPFYVMVILVVMGGSWDWQRVGGAAILCLGVILAQKRRVAQAQL